RASSLLVGGAGPAAAAVTLSHLERADHGVLIYLAVPAIGFCGWALAALAVHVAFARRERRALIR
ncbi:MAG TPA: hypothetical protein VGL13_10460, partial [Polyangiaceae bacterium]